MKWGVNCELHELEIKRMIDQLKVKGLFDGSFDKSLT